eukprot:TRINITY_DN40180_c0_g1_i4.p1 TRINITY_DN40180_c0_g1~~TRINITY_DN40180_c0_g1_i4.p1  ORF type:complete len:820 (-),score=139.79 TRINITY_DN40180_c0_g1_i4:183-2642(-)
MDRFTKETALKELGFQPNQAIGEGELRRCYLRKALACHPDKHCGDEGATERFKSLRAAYEFLTGLLLVQGPSSSQSRKRSRSRSDSSEEENEGPTAAASNSLRILGLRFFVASLIASPSVTWRRRLLYTTAGPVVSRKRSLRKRPRKFLVALSQVLKDMLQEEHEEDAQLRVKVRNPKIISSKRRREEDTPNDRPASAVVEAKMARPETERAGMWKKKGSKHGGGVGAYHVEPCFLGFLFKWAGSDTTQSLMAYMLAHSVKTTAFGLLLQLPGDRSKKYEAASFSNAIRAAIAKVEDGHNKGWPLPLEYGAVLRATSCYKKKLQSCYYFDASHALEAMREQQKLKEIENSGGLSREETKVDYDAAISVINAKAFQIHREAHVTMRRLEALLRELTHGPSLPRPLAGSVDGLANEVRQRIMGCIEAPLHDRLERLADLRRQGVLTQDQLAECVRQEIRRDMRSTSARSAADPAANQVQPRGAGEARQPTQIFMRMPTYFCQMARDAGIPSSEWQDVWDAVIHHEAVQKVIPIALDDVNLRCKNGLPALEIDGEGRRHQQKTTTPALTDVIDVDASGDEGEASVQRASAARSTVRTGAASSIARSSSAPKGQVDQMLLRSVVAWRMRQGAAQAAKGSSSAASSAAAREAAEIASGRGGSQATQSASSTLAVSSDSQVVFRRSPGGPELLADAIVDQIVGQSSPLIPAAAAALVQKITRGSAFDDMAFRQKVAIIEERSRALLPSVAAAAANGLSFGPGSSPALKALTDKPTSRTLPQPHDLATQPAARQQQRRDAEEDPEVQKADAKAAVTTSVIGSYFDV